eukprot:m.105138 g.105138  ORF g.105138 m.105138 type:complete len:130 (-) comp9123_c0_seq6:2849-3238(-)
MEAKKPRTHLNINYDGVDELKDNGIIPSRALGDVVSEDDNAALAITFIPKGSPLIVEGKIVVDKCEHDIPEGHRFTCVEVGEEGILTSWGIPFGVALKHLSPGMLLANLFLHYMLNMVALLVKVNHNFP